MVSSCLSATMKLVLVLSCLVLSCWSASVRQQRRFPDDFIFGSATASYQIEGAWDEDGKSENIWDHLTHNRPETILDLSNGDVAADSYHYYKRDVEMMRELGLDMYRFSLSWARLLPSGFANHVNQAGVDFYNNYINEMLKYNIEPMITLYHWDLPQKLQDLGGWTNPLITEWFEDYARVAYEQFGDRVKYWITFNEPNEVCWRGYGTELLAPMINATGIGEYICAKNLVMAHAKAYHVYDTEFRPTQGGICGITYSLQDFEPLTDSDEDKLAAELNSQGQWGIYAEPLFSKNGGFPKELTERVAMKSAAQGYPRSRLPEFTEEERKFALGKTDFFGINHYSGRLVSATEYKIENPIPSLEDDKDAGTLMLDEWPRGANATLAMKPNSLYNVLMDVKNKYDPIIYITENGWSTVPNAGLEDEGRVAYYRAALENVLDALEEGVQLKGYMAWSLLDNFEWTKGYTERFGLYDVDFEDPARTRTPRKSAFVYKEVVRSRVIDHDYNPDPYSLTMTIDEGH